MKSLALISTLFLSLFTTISCATGERVNPILPSQSSQSIAESSHYLWAYYAVRIDPSNNSVEMLPARDSSTHWNILQFLEKGPCTSCVKVVKIVDSGSGTKLVDVRITHPFTGANLTGFDVRGIAIFKGSATFPASGLTASDRLKGDGKLVNADGYTTLYNPSTLGDGPGGLQGYFPGKLSSKTMPDAALNGYKRFVTADPNNTRNAFYVGSSITVTYEIDMPDTAFIMGYAVDANWAKPAKLPVIDPMSDFPPTANCPEPWQLSVSEAFGKGLTELGSSTVLNIDVYDYQGLASHLPPKIECPGVFSGQLTADLLSDYPDHSSYQVTVVNDDFALEGTYRCLVSVEDSENATSPPWLNLTAYQIIPLKVIKSGWAKTWGGEQPDLATAVDVDASGNVYVTGFYQYTVNFDPGPDTLDATSNGSLDCYLSKFSPSGKLVWARTWGGAYWDQCNDVAVDDTGNVYVCGFFNDVVDFDPGAGVDEHKTNGDNDAFISKFDPNGGFLWARTWGGGPWDNAQGVAASGGFVYVTGEFRGTCDFDPGPGKTEYKSTPGGSYLSKFDSTGIFKWARAWAGDGGYDDIGEVVASDHAGGVYVAGVFDGKCDFNPGSGKDERTSFNYYQDVYLSKYAENGDYKWVRTWGNDIDDWPAGLDCDPSGDVYVSGNFGSSVDFDPSSGTDIHTSNGERDAYLTTFDTNGNYRWARTWGGSNGGNWDHMDIGKGLAVDSSNTIYVTGYFGNTADFDPGPGTDIQSSVGAEDPFITTFDSAGNHLWARSWGGPGVDWGLQIAVDSLHQCYVSGSFEKTADFDPGIWTDQHVSNGAADAFLTKFLPDGMW